MDKEFFLYRKFGENTWEMRSNVDSPNNGYMVTMIPDGTVVLSGDYGTLAFSRKYYPDDYLADRFPNDSTCLSYFAEKVRQHGTRQKITDWDEERAIKEITEMLDDDELPDGETKTTFVNGLIFETPEEMYTELSDQLGWDSETIGGIGKDYTSSFKFHLEILKQWTLCRDDVPVVDQPKLLLEKQIEAVKKYIKHDKHLVEEYGDRHKECLKRDEKRLEDLKKKQNELGK